MHRYLLRRLALAIPTLLGAVTLVFLVMRILPGDVTYQIMGGGDVQVAGAERARELREALGLDRPLYVQYGRWLWDAMRFDFGQSLWTGRPVAQEMTARYPVTIGLVVLAMLISLAVAIPTGVASALYRGRWPDYALRIFALAGLSVPSFFLGVLVLLALLLWFRWLPSLESPSLWADPWLHFKRLIFPALVIGYRLSAVGMRMTRSALLDVLGEDYIRTARAKGLRESLVVRRHAMGNALLPVVTLVGVEAIALLGGAVVVETVFTLPGIGRFLVDAVLQRDYPSVQAVVFVFSLFVLGLNLLVDVLYTWLDPRLKHA